MAETPLVEVKLDEKKLESIRKMLRDIPREMPKVMSGAINLTATSTKAETGRRLAKEVNLKQNRIKQYITKTKATYQMWQSVINLFAKRVPLIHFGGRAIKKGVSYQISRSGGRKKLTKGPGAPFKQTIESGHVGIFKRVGTGLMTGKQAGFWRSEIAKTGGKSRRIGRLPIIELFGPSVGGVFEGAAGVAKEVTESSKDKLERNIDSRIKYVLAKRKTR